MIPLPDEVRCKATIAEEPVTGIPLLAVFGVTAKNPYHFIFGPTDPEGVAALGRAEIVSQADETANLFLMDYHPLEGAFSGEIQIKPISHEDVRRALDAFARFRKHSPYPRGYQQLLESAMKNPVLQDVSAIVVTRLS